MKKDRELWKTRRVPFLNRSIEKLVFIDETSTNTKMAKQTGWAPTGERLIDFVPHGNWKKQTLIAGLRSHGLVAPWVIDRAMTKEIFEIYVETQLAPELDRRDVVILDHLAAHKSEKAKQILRDIGAWFLFLRVHDTTCGEGRKGFELKTLHDKDLQDARFPPRPSDDHAKPTFRSEQDTIGDPDNYAGRSRKWPNR